MDMPNLQPNRSQLVNALRDTAQSASNMVAENVSVPIDAIAWALRKAGVPVNKPMFGSDWMKEKGVTPEVEQSGAKVIGDTIGMLSPLGFTKQGAKALIDAGSAVKNMPVGMSVKNVGDEFLYHGTSPDAAKAIERTGFDLGKSADGSIWFTSNPNIGEVAASNSGAVIKRKLPKDLKLGTWDDADKYSVDELIAKGFDGLRLVDDGETTYQIFNPQKLSK